MNAELKELSDDLPTTLRQKLVSSNVSGNMFYVQVQSASLSEFVAHFHAKHHAWLVSEHVADEREREGCYVLYVIMALPKQKGMVTCLVEIDPQTCSFPSLTPTLFSANWFEREVQEMFGLVAEGHPDPRPLVLYDDWPEGSYPLRKDFQLNTRPPRAPSRYDFRKVEGEGVFEIPVGPVHAGVIEPGHFRFSVAGETVINLEIRLGYTHRGIEKLSESLPYGQGVLLAERISGDNGYTHSLAYCQTLEILAGAQVPERALCLRTVFSELERLYNHMGDVAGIILDTGFGPGAQRAYLLRERILDLNETVSGSRLLRSINCLGGVRRNIDRTNSIRINGFLVKAKLDLNELLRTVMGMPSFLDRTETTGILSQEAAKNLGVVGPVARASGVDRDVRRDHPYAIYDELSFDVPVHREGDVQARFQVKSEEIYESISIIEQALDRLPSGDITAGPISIPPMGIGLSLVETHRGEAMHWMLSGEGRPDRHKVRDASFLNWPALEVAVPGNIVPDFPLINKSFNLSYAGNDL